MEPADLDVAESPDGAEPPHLDVQPRAQPGESQGLALTARSEEFLIFQFDSIEWKVQHFYQSCKSLEYIEADREKPLMKIINNLGGETTVQSSRVNQSSQD